MQRRTFLRGALAGGGLCAALGVGLALPRSAQAAWPAEGMQSAGAAGAVRGVVGDAAIEENDAIVLDIPGLAENGAVVPVTIDATALAGVSAIALIVERNPKPLTLRMTFAEGTPARFSTRIKMGESSAVVALAQTPERVYRRRKEVEVTVGGCG